MHNFFRSGTQNGPEQNSRAVYRRDLFFGSERIAEAELSRELVRYNHTGVKKKFVGCRKFAALIDCRVRGAEVGLIGEIVEIRDQINLVAFVNFDRLADAHIPLEEALHAQAL